MYSRFVLDNYSGYYNNYTPDYYKCYSDSSSSASTTMGSAPSCFTTYQSLNCSTDGKAPCNDVFSKGNSCNCRDSCMCGGVCQCGDNCNCGTCATMKQCSTSQPPTIKIKDGIKMVTYDKQLPIEEFDTWYQDKPLPPDCRPYLDIYRR